MEEKARKRSNIIENSSKFQAKTISTSLFGDTQGLPCTIESSILLDGEDRQNSMRISFNYKNTMDRASVLGIGDKLNAKISKKFGEKYNIIVDNGILTFCFDDTEFALTPRNGIKAQKLADKLAKGLLVILRGVEKMIDRRVGKIEE